MENCLFCKIVTQERSPNIVYMHLIPRYEGDVTDPKGGVQGVIPAKQRH